MVNLGDIADFKNGKALSKECYLASGQWPVYGSNGEIARTDDILNTEKVISIGRVGAYCGAVYAIRTKSWVTDNAIIAEPKAGTDFDFLYYLLSFLQLNRMAIGSAQPLLTQSGLKVISLPIIPNYEQQKLIGKSLKALDDKIDLNNQINKILESMAQAIFKEWFIDFGPVKAKAEGRKPFGMNDETASLFPNSFEHSELGQIPKNWRIGKLDEIADIFGGGTPSTSEKSYYCEAGTGISWLSPKDLSGYSWKYIANGATDITESGFKNSSARMLPVDAVLFSSRAPIGYVALAEKEMCTNQGFKSIIPKNDSNSEFLYYFVNTHVDLIESRASGSTFKEISGNGMRDLPLVIPTASIMSSFKDIVSKFSALQKELRHETNNLIETRDLLLPKLISGEILLNDV